MKLKLFFLTALAIFLFPVSVLAVTASTFSVRLGQPKTPTNQNFFKLTFVALDTRNDRHIIVKCYKKGPSELVYSQFDVEKELIEGGNTDYCDVNSSVLNTEGDYSFYVTAEVPSEPMQTTGAVTVKYNTSGPDTPNSYSKEKLNDCDYKIKFKTANDGKTVKVELFRSDTRSISLDSGGRVATLTIAPNTEGEFINSVPTCGKEYYYVLRAVDSSDNVSGTVGDSFTTTTSTTTSTGTTTQGAAVVGTGSQVTEGTETTVSGEPSGTASTESGTPEVLGTENTKGNNLKWLSIPLILIAVYFFLKSRKRA